MMLNKLSEEDFAVLRGPLESGRQSPSALGGTLILAIFGQALFLFLESYIRNYSIYPHKEKVFTIHLVVSCILIIFYIIYAIPLVYMNRQKTQYLLIIIASQNIGSLSVFILTLFIIGTNEVKINHDAGTLLTFTFISLLFGLLIFIGTSIRFYFLLKRGYYRKGSKKDKQRRRFETKSYAPFAIIGSIGLVFIIRYLVKIFGLADIETVFMLTLAMGIFYTMIFILPEQLVILYCKFRFKSFNYSAEGNLYPLGSGSDINGID